MNCESGHYFTPHPVGYHFCLRCGTIPDACADLIQAIQIYYLEPSPAIGPAPVRPSATAPGDAAGGSAPDLSRPATTERPNSLGAEAAKPGRKPSVEPGGGGPAGAPDQTLIAARLQKYLDQVCECSLSAAINARGIEFGASEPTLYKLLKDGNISERTLIAVSTALDRLFIEDETPCGEVGPKIQRLPTTLPPITGTNPIPKPAAPPRCSKTP